MAKLTVLDMVQNILSSMDSDSVNSISDTIEAEQVAELLREAYYDLMSQREWPFLKYKGQLEAVGDVNNPTTMKMPDSLNKLYWIKYNKKDITYLDPTEFQAMVDLRVETTDVVDSNGMMLNGDPTYWTTFDDKYVIFDGIDKTTDTTLQQSKTTIFALKEATWTQDDDFIPDLPEKFFPTLLAEAKAACFLNLKQQGNQREERKAQRGRVMLRNESWRNENGEVRYNTLINCGRK